MFESLSEVHLAQILLLG